MGKGVTWVWGVASAVLAALVVAGACTVLVSWIVGVGRGDEDLAYHGAVNTMALAAHLPWFFTHYWVRPTLTGLLLPFVGVLLAPYLLVLLLLFTMETPGVTGHLRTIAFGTMIVAPIAGPVWFVARCRRRWARMVALAATVEGGRVVEVVESVHHGQWTAVRLVDVRTGEREQASLWGHYSRRDVCVVDGPLAVLDHAAAIVRGFGAPRVRIRPTTHDVTAPA
ncbi:hypothetical protein ACFWFR_14240 [Oerskovia sp. NPDC060287]|uniref:hypothetical protein n=1 Tax=Oerskovia sp. NPDC060287 TaxID=3347095 RepID=UPI00364C5914